MIALFDAYPRLRENLPHVALGDFPTPVQATPTLGGRILAPSLFVKRDDLSAADYGGNKVRKLEFLLGEAQRAQRKTVLTFGAAGSNHALATAIYARQLGMQSISMLLAQPNARYVAKNLARSHAVGADLHYQPGMLRLAGASLGVYMRRRLREGQWPILIAPGGTDPRGILGFVNAGFELAAQVKAGELPAPDVVYAASGTMGTAVGLMLGVAAAGLPTHVEAVRVTQPQFTSIKKARKLYGKALRLLRKADPTFPDMPFPHDRFRFRHEFFGKDYALFTEQGIAAVRLAESAEALHLEGTYTGKTMAALIEDGRAGRLRHKTVLFWNTYNSRESAVDAKAFDYAVLPPGLQRYFTDPVQPLDR